MYQFHLKIYKTTISLLRAQWLYCSNERKKAAFKMSRFLILSVGEMKSLYWNAIRMNEWMQHTHVLCQQTVNVVYTVYFSSFFLGFYFSVNCRWFSIYFIFQAGAITGTVLNLYVLSKFNAIQVLVWLSSFIFYWNWSWHKPNWNWLMVVRRITLPHGICHRKNGIFDIHISDINRISDVLASAWLR